MDILKLLFITTLLLILSCSKDEETLHLYHHTEAFHTLQLNDAFEVEIIEQADYGIEIIGSESFVEKTVFSVQDCTLSIRNDKKYKWTDPGGNTIKIVVKGMGLKAVHANESCQIKSLNPITTREFGIILKSKTNTADILVDNQIFYYWNNFPCGGKLTIRGKTNELKLWNYAIMSVDASALQAKIGYIENASKGDCTVNLSERLDYKIEGEGNIIVYGNAIAENQGSSDSGQLIRK